MQLIKNKKFVSVILVTLVTALSATLSVLDVFDSWQKKLTNGLFEPTNVRNDIVILELDDISLAAKDEGLDIWQNRNMAKVFENVLALNPSVVAIDARFNTPTSGIKDAELRNILKTLVLNSFENNVGIADLQKEFLPYLESPNCGDL